MRAFSGTLAGLLASFLLVPVADAAWVKPATITASSSLPADKGVNYNASNIDDKKVSTVWVEGEEGSGLGSWLLLEFSEPHEVRSITVWSGNWYSWDFWQRHNRAEEVEIELSDGTEKEFTLADEKKPHVLTLDEPVTTESVKLKIKGIHRGNTFNDTCISEVLVQDTAEPGFHRPAGVADSGHLPEDADGAYGVENTYDGILDTMWCENRKNGDGTGTWFEHRFGRTVSVSELELRNGNAYSMSFWMQSNRAVNGTLTFSDGSTESVQFKNTLLEQTVEFPTHRTSSVRITFGEVKKGRKYNDLCIAEARFAE